ncbi:MAG: cation:proton antiporter [Syntrophobacteraceae bacterium]|nr:cation:proton antiporter [Syntrophobacteraceae bacterium]
MVPYQPLFLLLVSLAALVLPGVSALLGIPGPVMEILFGVAIGRNLFHLQLSGQWLQLLAHLGFLLLMFHSGMEIDFGMLRRQGRSQLLFQSMLFALTAALSWIGTLFLAKGIFVAFVLVNSSPAMAISTLKETESGRSPLGQTLLIAASVADFLPLFGLTGFVLWHKYGLSWRLIMPFALFAGFALLLWAGRMWAWWNPKKVERFLGGEDPSELGVRLSLAVLFLFVAMSELAGIEPILGAFLGGCALSFVFREKSQLDNKLSALAFGFLIPIFFINVGVQLDFSHIMAPDRIVFALELIGLAFLVKLIPSLLLLLRKISLKRALQSGALLSSRLSLLVAAASIGIEEGLIGSELRDTLVLLVLFTCFLGPTVFKAGMKTGRKKPV